MSKALHKLLSYLIPITVKKIPSQHNGTLEITYENGKKVVNTAHTNYSYGSLQNILRLGLQALPFNAQTQSILVLGMGAGSVVPLIRNQWQSKAHITLVDIDPVVIQLAQTEFNISQFPNLTILTADAYQYIQQTQNTFDLIIVDLFIDENIPSQFLSQTFVSHLIQKSTGRILWNTLISTLTTPQIHTLQSYFQPQHTTQIISPVFETNRLIITKKIIQNISKKQQG